MINLFKVSMSKKAVSNVVKTLLSGMIGEGPQVVAFKKALEEKFKCRNLLPLNSCTSALQLALELIDVRGHEVVTTPLTMAATNEAILNAGGYPIFADINSNNMNVSFDSIIRKITRATRAIMVVHLAGIPCEMDKLSMLSIPVVSDAAQAICAYYKGKHISQWSAYTCFSFQAIKQLTTADGGALVIRDDKQYERAEKLKWFGITRKVPEGMSRLQHQMSADIEECGYKYQMNDVAASIGLGNLEMLDKITYIQNLHAMTYKSHLEGVPGITIPYVPEAARPSYWIFPLFVENRDRFISELEKKGIEASPLWRRNDYYSIFKSHFDLPNLTNLYDKIVFIPVGHWISKDEIHYIIDSIKEIQDVSS